ncbi:MAG: DUF1643 domain-containing protein [Acidimicrobiales bacterium]|jgi:hypothetical protein
MTILAECSTRSWSLSDCTCYRYSLLDRWGPGERLITWVMLNPSTTDETVDDATTLRAGEFSRRWGYDQMEIVNLFALRTAEPRELSEAEDPVGPKNLSFVRQAVTRAELVVVGWGDGVDYVPFRPETLDEVVRLRRANTAMLCFGLTNAGQPRHPGSLDRSTIPVVWTERRAR